MVKKYVIEFRPAKNPISAPVTKFGGQPFWLGERQWPLSRTTGEPMRFICQIALPSDVFGATAARMAYLFMSDQSESFDSVLATWDPDAGENAVILQPGKPPISTEALLDGPTLRLPFEDAGAWDMPGEFAVDLVAGDEPDFAPFTDRRNWTEEQKSAYEAQVPLDQHKIGGVPLFLQSDDFPEGGPWRLLLQLSCCRIPFEINFGDMGVGYAFINHSGTAGKFLWQCC